eukprot:Colp12_sorted_trinity150504_noHs@25047
MRLFRHAQEIDHDAATKELRSVLPDNINSLLEDHDVHRFLRARSWHVKEAEDMIVNWAKWRETPLPGTESTTPANILDDPADPNEEVYKTYMPHANQGVDKHGCPIYWEKTGVISSRFHLIKQELTTDDLVNRHVRQQEIMMRRLEHQSEKAGQLIEKQVIVLDLKDLSYSLDTCAINTFRKTVHIDEANYPERLSHLFMINAPWFFTAIWKMITPLLNPVTTDKIKILGSNYLKTLQEYIDLSEIPEELGGTNKDFNWQAPYHVSGGGSLDQLKAYNEKKAKSRELEAL